MRFRHKLSIVLVALTVLPLIAFGAVVETLLAQQQEGVVDARLEAALAGGMAAYRGELDQARVRAREIAQRPDVQRILRGGGGGAGIVRTLGGDVPVALVSGTRTIGQRAASPRWEATVPVVGGGSSQPRRVIVGVPLDRTLLARVAAASTRRAGYDLTLVAARRIVASTAGGDGLLSDVPTGSAARIDAGGEQVRGLAVGIPVTAGGAAYLLATYPQVQLDDQIDSLRLRYLLPLLIVLAVIAALALFAASRISRALSDLAQRALALARGERALAGDELTELGDALDRMSSELSTRLTELDVERTRLKETLHRYGETLAATHDLKALLEAVLDTAVQATRARGGRMLLYDPERGEAIEQVRSGSARGSRTDLPMVVQAGSGLEGEVLTSLTPRTAGSPRAILSVPILREQQPLGVVTVVDPEEGGFAPDDVETLSGLAVQAGVAIENAKLHKVVEQQAVTDALTSLANRRQFYEVLGREYERAQRFGQPVALILLDIDDFKAINDTKGHLAGDAVLHSVAATIAGLIREIDLAARYGGEEFAVLLPQTALDGATNLAERLRTAVESRPIPFGPERISVTASFGVACGPEEAMTQLDLIAAADAALYRAKREGKNMVSVAESW